MRARKFKRASVFHIQLLESIMNKRAEFRLTFHVPIAAVAVVGAVLQSLVTWSFEVDTAVHIGIVLLPAIFLSITKNPCRAIMARAATEVFMAGKFTTQILEKYPVAAMR